MEVFIMPNKWQKKMNHIEDKNLSKKTHTHKYHVKNETKTPSDDFKCVHQNPFYEKYYFPICQKTYWCLKCHTTCTDPKCQPQITCGFCKSLRCQFNEDYSEYYRKMYTKDYEDWNKPKYCEYCNKLLILKSKNFGKKILLAIQFRNFAEDENNRNNIKSMKVKKKIHLCKHNNKFFAEMKFNCCHSTFPCKECHNESVDHEAVISSYVCGFCKETIKLNNLGKYKGCLNCLPFRPHKKKPEEEFYINSGRIYFRYGCNPRFFRRLKRIVKKVNKRKRINCLLVDKGKYWEGGKGCLDKFRMSRKCLQKFNGLTKTHTLKMKSICLKGLKKKTAKVYE